MAGCLGVPALGDVGSVIIWGAGPSWLEGAGIGTAGWGLLDIVLELRLLPLLLERRLERELERRRLRVSSLLDEMLGDSSGPYCGTISP
jgi:hypothetical protein